MIRKDNFRDLTPYTPGEQPQFEKKIKLNTNENPYPPSPKVREVLDLMAIDSFRLYPDPAAKPLVAALAKKYGVEEEQIFTGVGSDEVLAMCFMAFFNSGREILFPEITYSFYEVWAALNHVPYRKLPLNEDLSLDPAVFSGENGGVIFPNPNAPTSHCESLAFVEQVLRQNPGEVVIVDEAYVDFAGEGASALSLLPKYENLLVVQTFSKARSMAGMRIGYAIGSKELIAHLNAVKNSFNSYTLNYASIFCGKAAVEDETYFKETIEKVCATRERAAAAFRELGFTFPEPKANFIFVKHSDFSGKELFSFLRERTIFVRHFDTPALRDYLRVSIGTDAEMEVLFAAIREFINSRRAG